MVLRHHSKPCIYHMRKRQAGSQERTYNPYGSNTIDPSLLLAFGPAQVVLHRWDDLSEAAVFDILNPLSRSSTHTGETRNIIDQRHPVRKINSVHANASGSHLLIDIVDVIETGQEHHTSILPTSSLRPSPGQSRCHLSPTLIPAAIQRQVEISLGLLPRQRMIFLDKDHWMCSWRVGANPASENIQRYYSLPKDWLNLKCLKLCALLADGHFLIPNNGEMAVIRSAAMSHW
ncbi:MAG: hypothetical protein L6R35_003997 [Caloplaca aegaea]|nr:MAG: hypothetical protein L6R35_003997 [Caloplaca aegaea]